MRHVWACRLDFAGDALEVAPRLRAVTRYWAASPHGGWPRHLDPAEGVWTPETAQSTLSWRTVGEGASRVWELTLDEPYVTEASLRSVSLVQIGTELQRPFAFLRLSIRATDTVIGGPVNLAVRPPELVAQLLDAAPAHDADERLAARPWSDPEGGRLATVVTHPRRRLPVVVVDGAAASAITDAGRLAALVAGLAHVAVTDAARIGQLLGAALAPPRGGARVLWPDVAPGDSEGHHRAFSASDLRGTSWEAPGWPVARVLFDAASVHLERPVVTERIEAAMARKRIEELRSGAAGELDVVMTEWEADLIALGEARRQRDEAEARAGEAEARHSALLDGFHALVERAVAERSAAAPTGRAHLPDLTAAIRRAEAEANNLVFLASALESASDHPYERPDKVFEDLMTLDALAGRWRAGRLEGSFSQEALAAGLPWSGGVSSTARNRFGSAYTFRWNDRTVLAGPHLRFGAAGPPARNCRVYLAMEFETRTVIVCHAGRHLPDATSAPT